MEKRQIIAGIVGIIGFLAVISAVSCAEFDMIPANDFYIRSGIGVLLMLASVPISGEMEQYHGKDDK